MTGLHEAEARALEALAGADAFAGTGTGASCRRAGWEARSVASGPQDLPLFALAAGTEAAPTVPDQTEGQAVVEDYLASGLTLRRHPLALLRPRLDALGCQDTRRLNARRASTKLRLPGLVLIRQRPGSANGAIFLNVEDEHRVANLVVVFEWIAARDRAALVSGRLLIAEGRVEREVAPAEVPITKSYGRAAGRPLRPAQPAVRKPAPGSQPPKLPGSRNFR
ncbi:hypothetical protein E2C06_27710 [Dankookia rubra]|uniref:Error-prone DNA polymerase n=1 Tax=Dankookia rubra TaxID=1442381 RepID=A0A4R5QAU0_9PROT|nr:hypothetical protein [Dankookia rubra]TDH59357.1 hypothetical protein E2C06_27710 [Dankookia rubra]